MYCVYRIKRKGIGYISSKSKIAVFTGLICPISHIQLIPIPASPHSMQLLEPELEFLKSIWGLGTEEE
jgi:hypothetical protein